MERKNIKTSPSCVTRDVMIWASVIKEKGRQRFVTIMVYVTMTQTSAALCRVSGSTFSPCTISQNSRGSGRSSLSRTLKVGPKSAA
eukprot:8849067-Ditylum_brightwellii.AAC.1